MGKDKTKVGQWFEVQPTTPEVARSASLVLAGIAAAYCQCEDTEHTACGLSIVLDALSLKENPEVGEGKVCSRCMKTKPLKDFRPNNGAMCIDCVNERQRMYYVRRRKAGYAK